MLPLPDGITQVCYVVRDLDAAMAKWIKLYGAGPFFTAEFKIDGHEYRGRPTSVDVRVGLAYSSSLNIELLQPVQPAPSIYHAVVAGGPIPGIGKSYFVDTLATLGVFTEIQELSDAVYVALDEMHQAHLTWDGHTDPIRPYPALRA